MRISLFVLVLASLASSVVAQEYGAARIIGNNGESVVFLHVQHVNANGVPTDSLGTGVILTQEGHVLAPLHWLRGLKAEGQQSSVTLTPSGRIGSNARPSQSMTVVRYDEQADLALLKFDGNRKDYRPVGIFCTGPTDPKEGSEVITIGFPKGSDRSVLPGIISNASAGRLWQTNLQVVYGYSGAPVFSTFNGRFIGTIFGGTHDVNGRSFITPFAEMASILRHLPSDVPDCPKPTGADTLLAYLKATEQKECDESLAEGVALQVCRDEVARTLQNPSLQIVRVVSVSHVGQVAEGVDDFSVTHQIPPGFIYRVTRGPSGKIRQISVLMVGTGRTVVLPSSPR